MRNISQGKEHNEPFWGFGAFIQIGFCWALMSQCLGGVLEESRKQLISLLSVQEIRGVRYKVKPRGKCT